jgi:hypothetical protein
MLFTMLSGEVHPARCARPRSSDWSARVDTDQSRRYKSASDMLENLL